MKKLLPAKQFTCIKKAFAEHKSGELPVAVNARDIHAWLEVGRDFSNWIKGRIDKYGFIEEIDYVIVESSSSPNRAKKDSRGRKLIEYHCSPDMLKQLAMIESGEKGRLARLYFLDCEARAKEAHALTQDRNQLKSDFAPMNKSLVEMRERQGKETLAHHFSTEANLIYMIMFGCNSKTFKKQRDIGKNETARDYLTPAEMKAFISLQKHNTVLLDMEVPYAERKEKLKAHYDKSFKQLLIDEFIEMEG